MNIRRRVVRKRTGGRLFPYSHRMRPAAPVTMRAISACSGHEQSWHPDQTPNEYLPTIQCWSRALGPSAFTYPPVQAGQVRVSSHAQAVTRASGWFTAALPTPHTRLPVYIVTFQAGIILMIPRGRSSSARLNRLQKPLVSGRMHRRPLLATHLPEGPYATYLSWPEVG